MDQEPKQQEIIQPKSNKGLKIAVVLLSIVAILGVGFGIYGMTTTRGKIDHEEKQETPKTSEQEKDESLFEIKEMGIAIKNLEKAGVITDYTYQMITSVGPHPRATFEILSFDPEAKLNIGTDSISGISGAIIYEYSDDDAQFFEPEENCNVIIGKIGKNNFCVARRAIDWDFSELDAEAKNEWLTWSEHNVDKLMEVLSNKENFVEL